MRLHRTLITSLVSMVLAGGAATVSYAQQATNQDEDFLKQVAMSGHYEIKGAMLALAMSEDDLVKAFAQIMQDDHQQLDRKLNELVLNREVVLPTEPSMVQQGRLAELEGKQGEEFDRAYTEVLGVKAHEETIALFEEEVEKGDDKATVEFAQKELPGLKAHLEHAYELQKHMESVPQTH